MGWASRAKVSAGNQKVEQGSVRFLDAKKINDHFKHSEQPVRCTMSDRTYIIDKSGTIRRAPVSE